MLEILTIVLPNLRIRKRKENSNHNIWRFIPVFLLIWTRIFSSPALLSSPSAARYRTFVVNKYIQIIGSGQHYPPPFKRQDLHNFCNRVAKLKILPPPAPLGVHPHLCDNEPGIMRFMTLNKAINATSLNSFCTNAKHSYNKNST